VPGHDLLRGHAAEGRLAGEHLVEHAAERVHVRAGVQLAPDGLLRAHVHRRADHHTGAGQVRSHAPSRARDAEVRHHGAAVSGEQDVLGLHVAVNHPLIVGVLQPTRDLPRDPHGFPRHEAPLAPQAVAERLAVDPRHGEPEHRRVARSAGGDLARVVHRDDVGVLETRGEQDLAQEPLAAQRGREVRLQHLESDHAVVAEVPGQPDGGHSAASELALDDVAAAQPLCEILVALIHSGQPRRGAAGNMGLPTPASPAWAGGSRNGGMDGREYTRSRVRGRGFLRSGEDQAAMPPRKRLTEGRGVARWGRTSASRVGGLHTSGCSSNHSRSSSGASFQPL
jgi:hypothetical protein